MKRKTLLDDDRVKLETSENDPGLHDYGIPHQAWRRGASFTKRFGAGRALELADQRAERAADRGDYESARRWRDLMAAIHAIQEDERLAGDKIH